MTIRKRPAREDRWYRRRTEIVDQAAQLFAANGYTATGVAEICKAVNLGKGSLYYYIESKENLLSLIHDRVMVEVLESGYSVASLNASPPEKLRLLGTDLVRIITQYPNHVWVFLHEWPALTGQRAATFKQKRRSYEQVLENILREGVEEGIFEIDDYRATVLAWLGMHNYTYMWYSRGGRLSPLQLAHHYYKIFVDGITARRSRRDKLAGGAAERST